MAPNRDPEVERLTGKIRNLTAEARRLARGIDETLEELGEHVAGIAHNRDRRSPQKPFTGAERRRD